MTVNVVVDHSPLAQIPFRLHPAQLKGPQCSASNDTRSGSSIGFRLCHVFISDRTSRAATFARRSAISYVPTLVDGDIKCHVSIYQYIYTYVIYSWRDAQYHMKIVLTLITTVILLRKTPTFRLILTSACSTPYTLQAGTVQRSDQHKQQGASCARTTSRNTALYHDTTTPITHTRRSSHSFRGQSPYNFVKPQHPGRRSEISSDIDRQSR